MENKKTTHQQDAPGQGNADNGRIGYPTSSEADAPRSLPQGHGWNTRENRPQKNGNKPGARPEEQETSQKQ